jgi:HK97 family phage prohead protease
MPYKIGESDQCPSGKPFAVMNSDTGKVHGCHDTRESALAQLRALYVNVPDASKSAGLTVTKAVSLNSAGSAHASSLVGSGDVDTNSGWSFGADDGNKLLGENGDDWANYGKWFLAVHNDQPEKTRARYGYPFGKDGKVYRSALVAIKQRAAAQGAASVEAVANRLIERIDGKEEKSQDTDSGPVRAWMRTVTKAIDEDKRIIEGIASTPSTDRQGDVVDPLGARFKLPLPYLWQHKHDQPIGWVTFAKPQKDGIPYRAEIAKAGVADFIDRAWALIKAGLVQGGSIGFLPIDAELVNRGNPTGGIHYKAWEWVEFSAVTIPANSEATIHTIKSFDIEPPPVAALGKEPDKARIVRLDSPGATGSSQSNLKGSSSMKTITEDIAAYENKRAADVARQKEIVDKSREEGRTLLATETEEYETLKGEVEAIDKHLVLLKDHQKLLLANAQPIDPKASGAGSAQDTKPPERHRGGESFVLRPNSNIPKGIAFARYAMAVAGAKNNREDALTRARVWRDSTPEVEAALKVWASPSRIESEMVTKTGVNAGDTTTSTWAAELAPVNTMSAEFVEYLYPLTILGRLPGTRRIPFNVKGPGHRSGLAKASRRRCRSKRSIRSRWALPRSRPSWC